MIKIRDLNWDKDTRAEKGEFADLQVTCVPGKMHEKTVTTETYSNHIFIRLNF